jgi:EAL domain-containing protein (putative c-di-GMP-specific phosphodiesterase class I)
MRIMGALKALGVSLTLDDFGTGWSSLSYLRQFPLDRIKIDRSFMRDVTTHENAAAVVQSILNLARSLGLSCVAEGVETAEQLQYLKEQLCPEIQGFLFSHPLPADEMPMLLQAASLVGLAPSSSVSLASSNTGGTVVSLARRK